MNFIRRLLENAIVVPTSHNSFLIGHFRGTGKSRNEETRNETKRNDILRLKGHGEAVHVHQSDSLARQERF